MSNRVNWKKEAKRIEERRNRADDAAKERQELSQLSAELKTLREQMEGLTKSVVTACTERDELKRKLTATEQQLKDTNAAIDTYVNDVEASFAVYEAVVLSQQQAMATLAKGMSPVHPKFTIATQMEVGKNPWKDITDYSKLPAVGYVYKKMTTDLNKKIATDGAKQL